MARVPVLQSRYFPKEPSISLTLSLSSLALRRADLGRGGRRREEEGGGRRVVGGVVGGVRHLRDAAVAVDGLGGGAAVERRAGGLRLRDVGRCVIVAERILVLSRGAAPEVGRVRRGARCNDEIVG